MTLFILRLLVVSGLPRVLSIFMALPLPASDAPAEYPTCGFPKKESILPRLRIEYGSANVRHARRSPSRRRDRSFRRHSSSRSGSGETSHRSSRYQTNRSIQSGSARRRFSLCLRSGRARRGRKTSRHDRRPGAADIAEREVHRRSRRVDDGACRVHPGVPGRHGAPRRDGPGLEGVLCQGAAGPRGARHLQAADGHRGRDQRRRVPRPHPQEAHRPGRISEEPVVVTGNDRRATDCTCRDSRAPTWRRAGCRPIRTRRCNWRSTT